MKKWIYLITNLINNKVYIGQTNNLERRKREHFFRYDRDQPLYLAFNKYGRENFTMESIEYVKNYNEREMFWIEHYNSYGEGGYNASRGGEDSPEASRVYGVLKEHYEDILYKLAWTRNTLKSICDKYGFSKPVIDKVNLGEYEHYFPSDYTFPIKHHGNSISHYMILTIQNQIIERVPFADITTRFGVGHQFLADLNSGRKFRNEELKYPLKETNPLSTNIRVEIEEKLKNDCLVEQILSEYNVSQRTLVKMKKNLK